MEPFNGLTPAQAERLALLAEECGEVIQAIGKVLRHGYESTHPDGGPTNRENLERECGDLRYAVMLMAISGDLKEAAISRSSVEKFKSVQRFLHHNNADIF